MENHFNMYLILENNQKSLKWKLIQEPLLLENCLIGFAPFFAQAHEKERAVNFTAR